MVGNNIGANKVALAKAYGLMCFKTAIIWAIVTILLLVVFRSPFIGLFSADPLVLGIITRAYPVMMVFVFIDCI